MNKFCWVRSDKYRHGILIVLIAALIFLGQMGCRSAQKAEPGPKPPVAEKIKKELTIHGQTRVDEYYWLRERENPKVLDYLKAENDYHKAVMKPTGAVPGKLLQRDRRPDQADGHVGPLPRQRIFTITPALKKGKTIPSTAGKREGSRRRKRSCSTAR